MRKNQKTKHPDTETSNVMIVQNAVQDEEDTITIPVVEIFHQLRKYVLLWVLIAVVAAVWFSAARWLPIPVSVHH